MLVIIQNYRKYGGNQGGLQGWMRIMAHYGHKQERKMYPLEEG